MTYKRGVPEPPTLKEAVAMANFFDGVGETEAADLLDEYVVKCTALNADLKKQAGIFSTIWKRLKGKVKMFFYGEYKELFRRAKEAQDELEERLAEMGKVNKELKKHLKNHELFDWRNKVAVLQNFYTKDVPKIMKDFDEGYSKVAAYLLGVKEQAEEKGLVPKTELEKVPKPSWMTEEEPKDIEEEGVSEPGKPEISAPETGMKREKGWYRPDPNVLSVEKNDHTGEIRITKERFNRYLGTHIVEADPERDIVKIIPHERKYPRGFEKIFGKGTFWQVTSTKGEWVYLMKVEELTKVKEKPEEVKPEEVKPEEVKPEEVKPEEVKPEEVPPPSEIPEPSLIPSSKEEEAPEPEESKPAEVSEEEVSPEEYLKGKKWVMYKIGPFKGKFAPITRPDYRHALVENKNLIENLNRKFVEYYKERKLPRRPSLEAEQEPELAEPEVPERTARMLRLISLIKQAKE